MAKNQNKKSTVFEDFSDARKHTCELLNETSRHIHLFSQSLTPALFAKREVVTAFSEAARRSRQSRIRILVVEPRPLYGKDIPLIHLAQRLPTRVEVRVYVEGAQRTDLSYVCIDRAHHLLLSDEALCHGAVHWDSPAQTSALLEDFEHIWHSGSRPDDNFKRLNL